MQGGVLPHSGETLGGIFGIERHIGAAGFQDAEDGDEQFERALDGNADRDVRADARVAEHACKCRGFRVELRIAQRLTVKNECDGIGSLARLVRDHLVDEPRLLIVVRRVVPRAQLPGVACREHRRVMNVRHDVGCHRVEHRDEAIADAGNRVRVEQVGAVLDVSLEARRVFVYRQRHIELRRRVRCANRLYGDARQRQVRRLGLIREQHLEDRRGGRIARRVHDVDEAFERQFLMIERAERRVAHVREQLAERHAARHVQPQRQRVDEEADERVGAGCDRFAIGVPTTRSFWPLQ